MHLTDAIACIAAKLLDQGEMEMGKAKGKASVAASVQARIDRLQAENVRLRDRLKTITDADSAQEARDAKARIARAAHRDGTKLPVRQGKSSARSHVLFAGQAPGDTAMTNIPQLKLVRVTFPKE